MRVKKRYGIRAKDFKRVAGALHDDFGMDPPEGRYEMVETDGPEMILLDGTPLAIMDGDLTFPALKGIVKFGAGKRWVTVDMGAVPFLANGAKAMAPGIVDADEGIQVGDPVWARDENNLRPLSVGIATQTGAEMVRGMGVAIETVHYVGDKIWKLFD